MVPAAICSGFWIKVLSLNRVLVERKFVFNLLYLRGVRGHRIQIIRVTEYVFPNNFLSYQMRKRIFFFFSRIKIKSNSWILLSFFFFHFHFHFDFCFLFCSFPFRFFVFLSPNFFYRISS